MLCSYTSGLRIKRLPTAVFFRILDISFVNSFVLQQSAKDKKDMTQFNFIKPIAADLVRPHMGRRMSNLSLRRQVLRKFSSYRWKRLKKLKGWRIKQHLDCARRTKFENLFLMFPMQKAFVIGMHEENLYILCGNGDMRAIVKKCNFDCLQNASGKGISRINFKVSYCLAFQHKHLRPYF